MRDGDKLLDMAEERLTICAKSPAAEFPVDSLDASFITEAEGICKAPRLSGGVGSVLIWIIIYLAE